MGPLGVTVLYDPDNSEKSLLEDGYIRAAFDIVAVHGLNGDSFDTWTHGKSGKLWLRDMLPRMLPETRMMTYGYNAKFVNYTSTQDLYSIASKLLSELVDVRRTPEQRRRPIVFICHSLGGIVAKKALLLHCTDPQQELVQQSAYGVIFMGTPHSGSDLASYGKSISNIVSACTPLSPATLLLKILRKDSNVLFELSRDFAKRSQNLTIVTFYEMDKTDFVLRRQMVVDMGSAILRTPNEVAIGQNANHREITKFSDAKDMNYRPVLSKLLKFGEDISQHIVEAAKTLCMSNEGERADSLPDESVPFEVPMLKDFRFRGREAVLAAMDQFFSHPPAEASTPLVYVVSGLGGAGKTQTAIRYAHVHNSRYRDGVFFINASSVPAINLSADRILSRMKAPIQKSVGGNNRIFELRKWLGEKGQWLLVFDGADDMEAFNIQDFFPQSRTGHIITTTRDQAAHNLSAFGNRVETLDPDAAVHALLDKAKMQPPSTAAVVVAKRITQMLGFLPLAIDHAGAYIMARQKSLLEYEELFIGRRGDVLGAQLRVMPREQTIQAAWAVNFDHLESTQPDAVTLLSLFAFLEPSEILVDMLKRGCMGKKTWDQHGEVAILTPAEAGIDQRLVDIVADDLRFDEAVEGLLAFSLVWKLRSMEGLSALALHPLVQIYAAERSKTVGTELHWQQQVILVICQAFPYSVFLDGSDFGDWGRQMFAHIPKVLYAFDNVRPRVDLDAIMRRAMIIMLLSASKFNSMLYKMELVERAKQLLGDDGDVHLSMWAVVTESSLLRIKGENERAYLALQKHIHGLSHSPQAHDAPLNPRINAERGNLVLSYASNLLMDGQTTRATHELEAWEPLDHKMPSRMEQDVAHGKHVVLGRVLRNEGRFQEAVSHYESLLKAACEDNGLVSSMWQVQLFCHLSDLYCEIGRPGRALSLLRPAMEQVAERRWNSTPRGYALQLCQAEALIRQGSLDLAQQQLLELDATISGALDETGGGNMVSRTKHYLVRASLARISHMKQRWEEALVRWHKTSELVEKYGWKRTFNEAITLLSLAQVLYQLDQPDDAEEVRKQAQSCLDADGRKYWLVALGSYWYEFVQVPLGESGPLTIARENPSHVDDMYGMSGVVRQWCAADASFGDGRVAGKNLSGTDTSLGFHDARMAARKGSSSGFSSPFQDGRSGSRTASGSGVA